MNGRGMALVNAVGCLVLGLLLVLQWRKQLVLDERIQDLKAGVVAARDQFTAERERTEMLGSEQAMLKESIESLQKTAEASGKLLAERDCRIAALDAQVAALEAQLKPWEAAIGQRDARIRILGADLTNARRRLDEAIARLKAADDR